MDQYDCETLEHMSSKYKIRYDNMDVIFGSLVAGTNVYVPINISNLLLDFAQFKTSLIDVKDFEMHAAISILNLFAHYRHFFKLKDANHIIIIGYVNNNYVYDQNKEIIDQVVDYCNFFPNVYMIPKILLDNRMYTHIVSAVMCYMKSVSPNIHQSSIFVVSNSSIDRQMMCLFPTRCAYTLLKSYMNQPQIIEKTEYMRAIMTKPMFYDGSPYKAQLECMNVLLGRYFNSMFKNASKKINKENTKMRYLHNKSVDKAGIISQFLSGVYDQNSAKSVSTQMMMYLRSSGELLDSNTSEIFTTFEKLYDFRYQNLGELNQTIIPLITYWRKKIKDYTLARDCESYKALIAHPLFSNWLG